MKTCSPRVIFASGADDGADSGYDRGLLTYIENADCGVRTWYKIKAKPWMVEEFSQGSKYLRKE